MTSVDLVLTGEEFGQSAVLIACRSVTHVPQCVHGKHFIVMQVSTLCSWYAKHMCLGQSKIEAHNAIWIAVTIKNTMGSTARCKRILLKARSSVPRSNRQSVDKLPLVREEKAKLAALNIQCTVFGAGMLA